MEAMAVGWPKRNRRDYSGFTVDVPRSPKVEWLFPSRKSHPELQPETATCTVKPL
jgi:hypothetical protein